MTLNDLLEKKGIDPKSVLVLRHRPTEPELNKVLPWLAAELPDVFNGYQQTQGEKLEKVMTGLIGTGYIASFIAHGGGKAMFVGLFAINGASPMTYNEYWKHPANVELKKFGIRGFQDTSDRTVISWFDLGQVETYSAWKGKLIIEWSPPERSWWRRAHKNELPVFSILEESALEAKMPEWNEIVLSWAQLAALPARWRSVLSQWRGIYYIHDTADGKCYVGSAYGGDNLYGRWLNYSRDGHGGNRLLRQRSPDGFQFSILQRVSPDTEVSEITRLEGTWKERLHTRAPTGLNDN